MKTSDIGVLIDRKNYSESSVILHFYTKSQGRQQFIFKGAKKKKNPLLAIGIYEITFAKRPESELGIIQELSRVSGMNEIYDHPQKSLIAFFVAEILKTSLKQSNQDTVMFQFLSKEIISLEVCQDLFTYPLEFLARFIAQLGYMPQIESEMGNYFDLNKGVIVSQPTSGTIHVSSEQLEQLSFLFIGEGNSHFLDKELVRRNLDLLIDYSLFHIPGFQVKNTREIIQDILYS